MSVRKEGSQNSEEYCLPDDVVILSTSDKQGNIVDFNEGFQLASGYSRAELVGKPHHILRHPDMPKEAFQDFWKTIQAGRSWFGMVKNRRKDGQYYWVAANVAPVIDNGEITGYVSVRIPATNSQKQAAENLYKMVREGKRRFPFTPSPKNNWAGGCAAMVVAVSIPAVWFASPGLMAGVFVVAGLAGLLYFWRDYQRHLPDMKILQSVESLCRGEFKQPVETHSPWGDLLNLIRVRMGQNASFQFDQLRYSQTMQTALDVASTNVMIVDCEFCILSMNRAMKQTFSEYDSLIQKEIETFSLDELIGRPLDVLYPLSHHLNTLDEDASIVSVTLGGVPFEVAMQSITQDGQRIGYVLEWRNLTMQAKIENNLGQAMARFAQGHLDSRIDTDGIDGFLLSLSKELNDGMEHFSEAMSEVMTFLDHQANANLDALPSVTLRGEGGFMQQALGLSISNTASLVTEIRTKIKYMLDSVSEIDRAIQEASQRTQMQATALEQSAATSEEIAGQAGEMRDKAHVAAGWVHRMEQDVSQAREVMKETSRAMSNVQASSQRIADIIGLIDGIAFQTNLLALNAAVEAARAGEHGRGFAVVAGEVRGLAQKSAAAAKDIADLIEQTVADIEQGNRQVSATENAIENLTEGAETLGSIMVEMEGLITQSADGVADLSRAISSLDDATQHNAARMEALSTASRNIGSQSSDLLETVSVFKTGCMREMLAQAERTNDFRFARARRMVRQWGANMEFQLLFSEGPCQVPDSGLVHYFQQIDIGEPMIFSLVKDLERTAEEACDQKKRALPIRLETFHRGLQKVIEAITAAEKNKKPSLPVLEPGASTK